MPTQGDAAVTVLSGTQARVMQGRVVDLSGRGLRLILPEAIAPNTAVKIEIGEQLLLGEVAYVHDSDGEWHIGVEVRHALLHTPDLERLRHSLLEGDEKASVTMKITPHGSSERRFPQTNG